MCHVSRFMCAASLHPAPFLHKTQGLLALLYKVDFSLEDKSRGRSDAQRSVAVLLSIQPFFVREMSSVATGKMTMPRWTYFRISVCLFVHLKEVCGSWS